MKTKVEPSTPIGLKGRIDYEQMPLLRLEGRIGNNSDKQALREFHDSRLLSYRDRNYHPAEYIEMLKNSKIASQWCGYENHVLEEAYNLTIDKFNNMPNQTDDEQSKPQGPDCRLYFLACYIYTTNLFKENSPANAIQAEIISAEMLRKMIDRQFYYSCLEARRKEYKFVRRYRLALDEGYLYLWLPWEIQRQRCREWLQANINIDDIDPQRTGEKERVQSIIDRLLLKRKLYFLSELHQAGEKLPPSPDPLPSMMEDNISVEGLASTVAYEKTENIKKQRRKIQQLGKEKLKKLIHTIFNALAHGEYVEYEIAASYGLSPATFSRFAGAHWGKNSAEANLVPPDLWVNVSHTLADHLKFVMAAKKAGVLKQVRGILKAEQMREDS